MNQFVPLSLEKQQELVRRTMTLAAATAKEGDLPFAALLVDAAGNVVLEAVNTTHSTQNAAAHAEINLLFGASEKLQTNDLSNYAVVSNAASCPMCATALIKAKITNFYYGAPSEGAMVPNITMDEVIAKTPFPISVHGGILADECAEQIRQLANPLYRPHRARPA
jgi:tRNA(adenine34) deaminase